MWPSTNGHEFEEQWTAVGQGVPKLEKYSVVPGLCLNFFFLFNDAKMGQNLVQAK